MKYAYTVPEVARYPHALFLWGCSSGNLKALNAGSVYLPANIYIQGQSALVLSDANGNGVIVEKFFFGEDRLNAILHGAVPQTAEEVYAKNLISLIP